MAKAEADATVIKTAADAEAYANAKITSSLSPTLVQYKMAGRWDGKLPVYSGSGANVLLNGLGK